MNPEDVMIPVATGEETPVEIYELTMMVTEQLKEIDLFLIDLASTFQQASEENKQSALDAFLALDAKRMLLDDFLASQLQRLRALGE